MWKLTAICIVLSVYLLPAGSALKCYVCDDCLTKDGADEVECEAPDTIKLVHPNPAINEDLANDDLIPFDPETYANDELEGSGELVDQCMTAERIENEVTKVKRGCVKQFENPDQDQMNAVCKQETGQDEFVECKLCIENLCNPANRAIATGLLTMILPIVTLLMLQ